MTIDNSTIDRVAEYAKVGVNGGIFVAPLGTAAPADLATAPASPWSPLGRISDDGLVLGQDEDSQSFTAWGEASPFRVVTTSSTRTVAFTAWETDRPIVKALHYRLGSDWDPTPDVDGSIAFADSVSVSPDRRSWVAYIIDGVNLERVYIPQGEITQRNDITYKSDTLVGYEWTLTCYPDDQGNAKYHVYLPNALTAGES